MNSKPCKKVFQQGSKIILCNDCKYFDKDDKYHTKTLNKCHKHIKAVSSTDTCDKAEKLE